MLPLELANFKSALGGNYISSPNPASKRSNSVIALSSTTLQLQRTRNTSCSDAYPNCRIYLSQGLGYKKGPPGIRRIVLPLTLACFAIFTMARTSANPNEDRPSKPNFGGTWTLDLQASDSLEPLMKHIGANFIERKFASMAKLNATFQQSDEVITVATRGPGGFALDEILYPDGRSRPSNLQLLGALSVGVRTTWPKDDQQLIVTYQIKTKQGKEGRLAIKRSLINEGKIEVVAYTLELNGDTGEVSARQFWNKQE